MRDYTNEFFFSKLYSFILDTSFIEKILGQRVVN